MCATPWRPWSDRASRRAGDPVTRDAIASALAEAGPLRLIVDNFEQLVASSANILERWCAVGSEAVVIVTSRERLAIAGEYVIELPHLELPVVGADGSPPREPSDAVALFVERARAVGGWDDARPAPD